jgi:8-oxo-dGTP pyrophosphatase MutT (NUDIX family)
VRFTNLKRDKNGWETRSTTTHFADDHLAVVTELVKTPTRSEPKPWTIVHRKAAVVIAPMTAEGKFVLIREERIPIRAAIWEMPAGQIDNDADEIEATALRELREETGYELAPEGELVPLGHFYSSPGFTDERCYFFLARDVRPVGTPEDDSIVESRVFGVAELRDMIASNEIRDGNTLSICARMAARGFFSFNPQS